MAIKEMKKKFFVPLMGALVLGVTAYAGYRTYDAYVEKQAESNLLLENIEALAEIDEAGNEGEEDGTKKRMEECFQKGGNWNESTRCVEGGFETFKCEISGEISLFGITLKGSYTKGNSYRIAWARYDCEKSEGNCCTKQGLYTGDQNLA